MSAVEGTEYQQNPAYVATSSLVSCEQNVAYNVGTSSGPHPEETTSPDQQIPTPEAPVSSDVYDDVVATSSDPHPQETASPDQVT